MAERQDIYLFVYLIRFVLTCEMKAKVMLRRNIVTNTCLYIKSIISIKTKIFVQNEKFLKGKHVLQLSCARWWYFFRITET